MPNTHLYLLGGDPNMLDANTDFIEKAGGKKARIALLFANSEGWENFLSLYTNSFDLIGIRSCDLIVPGANQELTKEQLSQIKNATGIFIGGGVPELYHKAYVQNEKVKRLIYDRFQSGVPVAACSAGALISLKQTYLLAMDGSFICFEEGLGLLPRGVIGVHYTQYAQEEITQTVMDHYESPGFGIDENACAYFENDAYKRNFGLPVHVL
jgi:cyanophycinase